MLTIGLTGNIGAGKSSVARLLAEHGAAVVDADLVARQVVEPGAPAYQPLIDQFGPAILDGEGRIDRPTLAGMVFGDPEQLAALNAVIHPAIGVAMIEGKDAYRGTDRIVIMDIPLLKVFHREMLHLDAVVVVDVDPEVARHRLVTARGMDPEDARARQAAQPSREERLEGAEFVIDNSGDEAHLRVAVDRLWSQLLTMPQSDGDPPTGQTESP